MKVVRNKRERSQFLKKMQEIKTNNMCWREKINCVEVYDAEREKNLGVGGDKIQLD